MPKALIPILMMSLCLTLGVVGGFVYVGCCEALLLKQIDDPLEAKP